MDINVKYVSHPSINAEIMAAWKIALCEIPTINFNTIKSHYANFVGQGKKTHNTNPRYRKLR